MTDTLHGSYLPDDVKFLLKDLSAFDIEQKTEIREKAMQGGGHYSESLPVEYRPSEEYKQLFHALLEKDANYVARLTLVLAMLIKEKYSDPVLVSLARAGTPVGVLLKRAISFLFSENVEHYSVSIIRDKGIDLNALKHILQCHDDQNICFVDGWTGKGIIGKELDKEISLFNEKNNYSISSELAVIADPAHATNLYATRKDILIPSACLNSTVSGLMSRTVLREDLIKKNDFHGAKYYKEFENEDFSREFIEKIVSCFPQEKYYALTQFSLLKENKRKQKEPDLNPDFRGWTETQQIQKEFGLPSINLVKPGIGETTRVLLRRMPWKILHNEQYDIAHIKKLCEDRKVDIIPYNKMSYACCGLIEPVEGDVQ